MILADTDQESPDSGEKHVMLRSNIPQNIWEVAIVGDSLSCSDRETRGSSEESYDHNSGHPAHDNLNNDKATKQWPANPQKSASLFNEYVPSRHLPLTPAQTPTRVTKRSYSEEGENNTTTPRNKRRFFQASQSPSKSPFRRDSIPSFSILYNQQAAKVTKISALELKRASESILSQVDWDEVEENVASNRSGSTFRKAIKSILQERVDELFEDESSCSMLE